MTPTGNGPGAARNDADRADLGYLREIREGVQAAMPEHRTMVLWKRQIVGVDSFEAVCHTCGRVGRESWDKTQLALVARDHETNGGRDAD